MVQHITSDVRDFGSTLQTSSGCAVYSERNLIELGTVSDLVFIQLRQVSGRYPAGPVCGILIECWWCLDSIWMLC
jgi:hypothetical protein